jgi:hypothetical protein
MLLNDDITIIEGDDSSSSSTSEIDEFMGSIEDLIEKNKYLENKCQKIEEEKKQLFKRIERLQDDYNTMKHHNFTMGCMLCIFVLSTFSTFKKG